MIQRFFLDPLLRAPTLGSMMMCLLCSMLGVLMYVRRHSLIGEALSHSTYPGVILGIALGSIFSLDDALFALIGAFLFSWVGMALLNLLRSHHVPEDASLCFVLSSLLGFGVFLISVMQRYVPQVSQKAQVYLYGQAATLRDEHLVIYALLTLSILVALIFLHKRFELIIFDSVYAQSIGTSMRITEGLLNVCLTTSIVIGLRSVGVVLVSGMLIAPAIVATQWSKRLKPMIFIAALTGLVSGFLGNVFSYMLPQWLGIRLSLPTGPMIIIVSLVITLISVLFARKQGIVSRAFRILRFKERVVKENVLKTMWKRENPLLLSEMFAYQHASKLLKMWILYRLKQEGWIKRLSDRTFGLTSQGIFRAKRIVRLHRLWELYLTKHLGYSSAQVHRSAEEVEHLLTPELEAELTQFLDDPKSDPHAQPIPERGMFHV